MRQKQKHSIVEDVLALVTAAVFVSIGLYFFKISGFLTGGTAGVALLLTYALPFSFGQIFFVVNLPFYYLAFSRMGWRFAANTFITVTIVSLLTDNLHRLLNISTLNPIFAAISGGLLIGMGMLIMFRHVSSLGGLGVLSFYIQDRFQISAGKFQMIVDVIIVCIGFFLVHWSLLLLSILGAVALNIVIALNHKPGRYQIN